MKSVLISALLFVLSPVTLYAQSLEGVWTADEVIVGGGEDEGHHMSDVQPSIVFFSKSHYAFLWVHGYEPRADYGENPTDAELLAALRAYGANGGEYTVQGSTVNFTLRLAKVPSNMDDTPLTFQGELEWDDDGFWMTFDSNDGDWQDRVHYVRLED